MDFNDDEDCRPPPRCAAQRCIMKGYIQNRVFNFIDNKAFDRWLQLHKCDILHSHACSSDVFLRW